MKTGDINLSEGASPVACRDADQSRTGVVATVAYSAMWRDSVADFPEDMRDIGLYRCLVELGIDRQFMMRHADRRYWIADHADLVPQLQHLTWGELGLVVRGPVDQVVALLQSDRQGFSQALQRSGLIGRSAIGELAEATPRRVCYQRGDYSIAPQRSHTNRLIPFSPVTFEHGVVAAAQKPTAQTLVTQPHDARICSVIGAVRAYQSARPVAQEDSIVERAAQAGISRFEDLMGATLHSLVSHEGRLYFWLLARYPGDQRSAFDAFCASFRQVTKVWFSTTSQLGVSRGGVVFANLRGDLIDSVEKYVSHLATIADRARQSCSNPALEVLFNDLRGGRLTSIIDFPHIAMGAISPQILKSLFGVSHLHQKSISDSDENLLRHIFHYVATLPDVVKEFIVKNPNFHMPIEVPYHCCNLVPGLILDRAIDLEATISEMKEAASIHSARPAIPELAQALNGPLPCGQTVANYCLALPGSEMYQRRLQIEEVVWNLYGHPPRLAVGDYNWEGGYKIVYSASLFDGQVHPFPIAEGSGKLRHISVDLGGSITFMRALL